MVDELSYGTKLAVAALATWRVTHLLSHEDGPADVIVKVRARLGLSFLGSLMDCFHCLSFWIAALAALYISRSPLAWVFNWLALSGAACLLQSFTREAEIAEPDFATTEGTNLCAAVKNEEL